MRNLRHQPIFRTSVARVERHEACLTVCEDMHLSILDLRGPAEREFAKTVYEAVGIDPLSLNRKKAVKAGHITGFWIRPTQWWLVVPTSEVEIICARLGRALEGMFHVLADHSQQIVHLTFSGAAASDILSKGCSLPLAGDAFPLGTYVRCSVAGVTVLVHHDSAESTYHLLVDRSLASFFLEWLADAAAPLRMQTLVRCAASPENQNISEVLSSP